VLNWTVHIRTACHSAIRLLVISIAFSSAGVNAQTWPSKPIRVIVPWPPGGVVDVMTRFMTTGMSHSLGQPIIIEHRPGAISNIGTEVAAKADPDGYTLLASNAALFLNPMIDQDLRWKTSDFVPIARFSTSPSLLVVPSSSPASSVKDFIALAKAKPGLPVGDPGTGTPQSMSMSMLQKVAAIELEHIVYKGGAPVVPDLMNGTLSMSISAGSIVLPALRSGRVRALATIGDKRSAFFPDVPTMAELGYPAVTAVGWQGFHAPAGTPREVVQKLSAAAGAAADREDVKSGMTNAGGETAYLGFEGFDTFLAEDIARWRAFVQATRKR
jgi:tripartite-type tricarboxylate transporter receptor subunit TctC